MQSVTGIGLAVSQEFAHRMGGEITVSSELGFGSTFVVSIRVPTTQIEESINHMESQPSLRIFMVEDIELNITVARSVLENLGHSLEVAMSGEEALRCFKPENYDLVFLDIQLPDMTGFDIAQQLRQTYSQLPPLVALTANVMKNKQEYIEKGIDDAISKPLSIKDINRVVSDFFGSNSSGYNSSGAKSSGVKSAPKIAVNSPNTESISLQEGTQLSVIDTEMLNSYLDIVGKQPVLDSLLMFEQTIPDYMQQLNQYLSVGDDANLVSEAHKIKGAAGSVGLQRIQQLAQLAQTPEAEEWRENVAGWIENMNQCYQQDINTLKRWIERYA